jgi:hypothetical protein
MATISPTSAENSSLFEIDQELEAAFEAASQEQEQTGEIGEESRERCLALFAELGKKVDRIAAYVRATEFKARAAMHYTSICRMRAPRGNSWTFSILPSSERGSQSQVSSSRISEDPNWSPGFTGTRRSAYANAMFCSRMVAASTSTMTGWGTRNPISCARRQAKYSLASTRCVGDCPETSRQSMRRC